MTLALGRNPPPPHRGRTPSTDGLALILAGAFGPVPAVPPRYMRRRGSKDPDVLAIRQTEIYCRLAQWAAAAWPTLEHHVELMADTLAAGAGRVADAQWSLDRLARHVHEAALREELVGRPGERKRQHTHRGQPVQEVSLDDLGYDPADQSVALWSSSQAEADLASPYLRAALKGWEYLLTDAAAVVVDECFALTVDHLRRVGDRTGLRGADLLAACWSDQGNSPGDRLALLLDHLPRLTRQAAARILIGSPGRRGSGLVLYLASNVPASDIPVVVLTGWRADIPALDPALAALPGRRLERLRTAAREARVRRSSYLAAIPSQHESIAV